MQLHTFSGRTLHLRMNMNMNFYFMLTQFCAMHKKIITLINESLILFYTSEIPMVDRETRLNHNLSKQQQILEENL